MFTPIGIPAILSARTNCQHISGKWDSRRCEMFKLISHTQICMSCCVWKNPSSLFISILAAPGVKIVPTATGVVISQTAQVYQPHLIVQPAIPVKSIHTPSFDVFVCLFFQGCSTVIQLYQSHLWITLFAGIATGPAVGTKDANGAGFWHWSSTCACCNCDCSPRTGCSFQ